MPARIPAHFGFAGNPDEYPDKSFWPVTLLLLAVLVAGVALPFL